MPEYFFGDNPDKQKKPTLLGWLASNVSRDAKKLFYLE
jgi:hypothetical protein